MTALSERHTACAAALPEPSSPRRIAARKRSKKVPAIDTTAQVDVQDLTIPGGPVGQVWLRLVRPAGAVEPLPVVIYIHGNSMAIGNARTRRPATRLATATRAAVVVVDYSLSPQARIPIALEEAYTAAAWVAEHGAEHGLDGRRIAVTADAESADMAAELMIMADQRSGPTLAAHVAGGPPGHSTTATLRAALAE